MRPTERGHAAVAEARRIVAEIDREWTEFLGEERMAELRGLLEELHERLWPDG